MSEQQQPIIILFSGWSQAGKDTAADLLVKVYGFQKFAFAEEPKIATAQKYNFPLQWTMTQPGKAQEILTENGELRGEDNPYCITKIEGERELSKLIDPNFGIIFIRPGDVYGPNSMPWVMRPLDLMKRGFFALPDGGNGKINLTYVDNLAHGVYLAIEEKAYGEAFNITDGETLTWKEYFTRLADAGGHTHPMVLPAFLLKGLVRALGF